MLERLVADLQVARLASARIVTLARPGLGAALEGLGISAADRALGAVADRRAWARLLERIEGRDLDGERTPMASGPLSDAFRAYVKAKEAPFDHDSLKRAPGVQLMMLERLEQVTTRRIFGHFVAVGNHERAGWCAISTGERLVRGRHDPGLVENVPDPAPTSTVAAAVKSALVAFEAPARIAFGATADEAIESWIAIAPSSPPRLGRGPTFERIEAELREGRAISVAHEGVTTTIAWDRERALALRSYGDGPLCEAFEKRESADAQRIRERLEARMPWREETATALVVPWWEAPLPVCAALPGDRVVWRIHDEDVTWFAVRGREEAKIHVDAYDESGAFACSLEE